MRVLWLDPFHAGSHRSVAQGFATQSRHEVTIIGLPQDGGWRWRMRGAGLSFVRIIRERWGDASLATHFDVVITTDMCDVASMLGVGRKLFAGVPVVLYMHENQLTYPLPAQRKPDLTWSWINYTSALAADMLWFNSDFHRQAFLQAVPTLPRRFHDYHEHALAETLAPKSVVCHPGIDLQRFDAALEAPSAPNDVPLLVWNSRWDYDKQPEVFLQAVQTVMQLGVPFQLAMLGEYVDPNNAVFAQFQRDLAPVIAHWGYVEDAATYQRWLARADTVVSAAVQEFFGIAVIEAAYCGAVPLLPNRLAYPELVPSAWHDTCLYADDAQLVPALVRRLTTPRSITRSALRNWAIHYDWSRVIGQYDALIDGLVGAYSHRIS